MLLSSPYPLRGKTEPDMISRPHPVSIAKRRAQQLDDLGEHLPTLELLELVEEGTAEGLEPPLDADIESSRPRHEHDRLDRKIPLLEQPAIFGDRGKEPRRDLVRIAAMQGTDRAYGGRDRRHIAMPAKLAGEAASRAKRPADACDHELWPAHPVQRRIAEHRVELILERKRVAVDPLHIEPLGGSGGEQLVA